jgi:hypothetical protein
MLDRLLLDYPDADGLWIWISEAHRLYEDDGYKRMAKEYRDKYGHLVKPLDAIRQAGLWRPTTDDQLDSDFAYLHLASRLVAETRENHPGRKIGIAWCGRLYLFDAMDAIFMKDVPLLSLEACICWCRETRVPMEWGALEDRETWLVPRLDDDVNSFGPQWNVELYCHDRVLSGSKRFGFDGILAQTCNRWRGLEHNADFLARGYWDTTLKQRAFYRDYVRRSFGETAAESIFNGFMELERFERFLGRDARVPHGGISYFSGLMNFVMYFDTPEIRALGMFRDLKRPFDGPRFPGNWDVGRYDDGNDNDPTSEALDLTAYEGYEDLHMDDDGKFVENCAYRRARFAEALPMLQRGRALFETARSLVLPGAREELDYMIHKLDLFERHIAWVCKVLDTWLAMDRAFACRARGERQAMLDAFDAMRDSFAAGLGTIRDTVRCMAESRHTATPSERYLLFRYHVRCLNPTEAFAPFITNLRNFHHGVAPYWQPVHWEKIRLTQWMEM